MELLNKKVKITNFVHKPFNLVYCLCIFLDETNNKLTTEKNCKPSFGCVKILRFFFLVA